MRPARISDAINTTSWLGIRCLPSSLDNFSFISRLLPVSSRGNTPWGGRALVLDGRFHAEQWKREISAKIALRKETLCMQPPGLAAVVVGDRPDSLLYVRRKGEACEEVGIKFQLEHLPENTDQATIIEVLRRLNSDDRYHGILLQLPVPKHLNESRLPGIDQPS